MALTPQQSILLNDRNVQIGNICFQWAHLEFLLALAVWSMLRMDKDTGKIITGGLDILQRTNFAIRLAVHLQAPGAAIQALKTVRHGLQDGKNLLELRNRAVHGHRSLDPSDAAGEFAEVHRGKGAGVKHRQGNKELAALGRAITETHQTFYAAMMETGVYLTPTSRPTRIIAPKASRNTGPSESTDGS